MTIEQLKNKNKQAGDFAEACFNTNSISELRYAIENSIIDETDLKTWKLTVVEYLVALKIALEEKINHRNFN